jgi:hypothetical protein
MTHGPIMTPSPMRRPCRWAALSALSVLAIAGCVPPRALATAPAMAFDSVPEAAAVADAPASAPSAPLSPDAPREPLSASSAPAAVASSAPASQAGSGAAAGPGPAVIDPAAGQWWLPGGQRLALAGLGELAVPSGVVGLVSLMAPGRVPTTVEVPTDGLGALHPRAIAPAATRLGHATLEGRVVPATAGWQLTYVAPDQAWHGSATSDSEGRFALRVPLDGAETGVVVARAPGEGGPLAAAVVAIRAGETTVAPVLMPAPALTEVAGPALPDGWRSQGATLAGVPEGTPTWRAPLLAVEPDRPLPVHAMTGLAPVAAFSALGPDGASGGLTSGPPGAVPALLAAPDLSGLPTAIAPEQTLDWPAVPGARLYTLALSAPGLSAPVWEAAVTQPRVVVPPGLATDRPGLVLLVCAWDAPEVSIYSVAAARRLRLPAGPPGPTGRMSWTRRPIGAPAK